MPLLILLALGVVVVVFVLRVVIGLFTRPVDTVQMLGTWACNAIGLLALFCFAVLLGTVVFAGDEADAERVTLIVVAGAVMIVAFSLSSWLRKRRLRNMYKQHIEAERAAQEAVQRQWQRGQ